MQRRILPIFGLVLSLILAGSLVAIAPAATAQGSEDSTTPGDILDSPDDYYDQDVTIQNATVGDSISGQAFTLSRNGDELLVVGNRDDIPNDISADSTVTIEGTVREFTDDADFVDDLGITADQRAFRDFEGDPVVYADSVEMTEGDTDESDESSQDGDQTGEITPLVNILRNPGQHLDSQVTLLAQVDDRISPDAWTVSADEANDNLLVLMPSGDLPTGITQDALVRVSGTVRSFSPDEPFEFGNGDTVDSDDDRYDDFREEPVLAADSLELVAPALGWMVENILDDTDAYLGERVTVLGTVDDVGGNQAFSFDGPEGFLGFSEETLLVVGSRDAMSQRVEDDALVRVTGTVRPFDTEDDSGWGTDIFNGNAEGDSFEAFIENTDGDFISDFDDDPVVVVESMEVLAEERGNTIEDILDNTDDYLGTDVTVAGMVDSNVNSQAFTLEGTDGFFGIREDNLLVIGTEQKLEDAGVTDDVIVIVSGTLRQYDPGDQFDVDGDGIDLQDTGSLSDWEGDEVLVADSVNVVTVD
ncbi:MAG: hypothetical protein R3A46_15260 [Thermomicrobiales bacterium]